MNTIEFSGSEIYVKVGSSWSNRNSLALSIEPDKIISVQDLRTTVGSIGLASLTYIKDNDEVTTITVNIDADGVYAFKALSTVGEIMSAENYAKVTNSWVAGRFGNLWINAEHVSTVAPTNFYTGATRLYTVAYITAFAQKIVYTTEEAANRFRNMEENAVEAVVFHPSTEHICVNEFSLCYDVNIVNHDTGTISTFHTPHRAADWTLDSRYDVTPYGGFLAVFRTLDGSRYFLYFFDNEGNLVDQIDGFGPGYQWGTLSYRLVYGTDNDPDTSVLKIFDGKNIRRYEFPGLCNFYMSPFSEGDCSKNLYVPFQVYSVDEDKDYLYISTPSGDLINLDYDAWYNNEVTTTVHPSSDKIYRMVSNGLGIYQKLEMYSEDMTLLSTLNLDGMNFNDWYTKEYYGANGNFYISLLNNGNTSVPFWFINASGGSNRFQRLEVPNGGTLKFEEYYRDYDIYDDYSSKTADSLVIVTGLNGMSPSPAFGMSVYQSGAKINWTSPTTGEWFSYEVKGGISGEVLISDGEGAFGTYPLFIIFKNTAVGQAIESLVLQHDGSTWLDGSGIVDLEDATSLFTYPIGNYTLARVNTASNEIVWRIYDTSQADGAITSNNVTWYINGDTVAVLDVNTVGDSWAWNVGAGKLNFPVPEDTFAILGGQWGADYPIWGYNNNGAVVLVDRDTLGNGVGFYFLTPNGTEWVHVVNTFDDNGGYNYAELGNQHFLYVCTNNGNTRKYAFVYNMTTGALVSATGLDDAAGPVGIEQVGDRMMIEQETAPGIYDQYYFTKKGVVQLLSRADLGNRWFAFNDAEWSWD